MTEVGYIIIGAILSHVPATVLYFRPMIKRLMIRDLAKKFYMRKFPGKEERDIWEKERMNKLRQFCVYRTMPKQTKDLCLDVAKIAHILGTSGFQSFRGDGSSCMRMFLLYGSEVLEKDEEAWEILEKIFEIDKGESLLLRQHSCEGETLLMEIAMGTDRSVLQQKYSHEEIENLCKQIKKHDAHKKAAKRADA